MTIEVKGHLHALEAVGGGISQVAVTFQLEDSRPSPALHRVTFVASQQEITEYKIGMPVIVQVRPA